MSLFLARLSQIAWLIVLCVLMPATTNGLLLDPAQPTGQDTSSGMKIPTTPIHPPTATSPVMPAVHNDSQQPTTCEDTMPNCYQYGHGPCTDPVYQSWARAHCALHCGFCNTTAISPLACTNSISNCNEYDGGDLCTSSSYYTWAYENCKGYCKFDGCGGNCTDSPNLDCIAVNITTDICTDKRIARPFCPHFCGFCDIVDGVWATWSVWSQCDRTCDNGTQVRTRTCTNPPPSPAHDKVPAGNPCVGDNRETQTCTKDLCPVHGSWGSWSGWGQCSVTCGIGMQHQDRQCDDPKPARNGDHCFGEGAAYRICFPGACADGDWSNWQQWSNCSVECGGGLRSRHRTCDNPPPSPLGRGCQGNNQETGLCNNAPCASTDGAWSSWSAWGTCSATCNGGLHSRTRTCTNPAPSTFGRDCRGNDAMQQSCNDNNCPATDGAWSIWTSWGTCDGNLKSRTRNCTNPAPSRLGRACLGNDIDKTLCNVHVYQVGPSAQPVRVVCSFELRNQADLPTSNLGAGLNTTVPLLRNAADCQGVCKQGVLPNGAECWAVSYSNATGCKLYFYNEQPKDITVTHSSDSRTLMFIKQCRNDGAWSSWSAWGTCSATCNGGLQSRNRTCTNPAPSTFGRDCRGNDVMQQSCNTNNCPATDGIWSSWSAWGTCSATCNGGLQSRTRNCTNPAPSQFGRACLGTDVMQQSCNTNNCPDKKVGFSVYLPHSALTSGNTPTFSRTIFNTGSYNSTTGKFTCPMAGLYSFSLTLRSGDSSATAYVYCWYRINGADKSLVYSYHDPYGSASGTMIANLSVGDVVDLGCGGWEHVFRDWDTKFSGVLITAA